MVSASRTVASATLNASMGCWPTAVSSESMMASHRSRTALVTSDISALVGAGATTMDQSIWVAITETLPASLDLATSCFWTMGTRSMGISTPKSPLATMMPSTSGSMVSMLSTPSPRSNLAITSALLPAAFRCSLA